MTEELMREADGRAARYLASVDERDVFPSAEALEGLSRFDEPLPEDGTEELSTLELLDNAGTPATVTSNGPGIFVFAEDLGLWTARTNGGIPTLLGYGVFGDNLDGLSLQACFGGGGDPA